MQSANTRLQFIETRYRHIIHLHSSSGAIQRKIEYYLAARMPFILALAINKAPKPTKASTTRSTHPQPLPKP